MPKGKMRLGHTCLLILPKRIRWASLSTALGQSEGRALEGTVFFSISLSHSLVHPTYMLSAVDTLYMLGMQRWIVCDFPQMVITRTANGYGGCSSGQDMFLFISHGTFPATIETDTNFILQQKKRRFGKVERTCPKSQEWVAELGLKSRQFGSRASVLNSFPCHRPVVETGLWTNNYSVMNEVSANRGMHRVQRKEWLNRPMCVTFA